MTTGNYERVCVSGRRVFLANRSYFGELEEGREGDWGVLRFLLFTGVKGSEDVLDMGWMGKNGRGKGNLVI